MTKDRKAELATMWIEDDESKVFHLWSNLDNAYSGDEQDAFDDMNYNFCKVLFLLLILDRQ